MSIARTMTERRGPGPTRVLNRAQKLIGDADLVRVGATHRIADEPSPNDADQNADRSKQQADEPPAAAPTPLLELRVASAV
jgi:hypothetical protein